MEDLLWVVGVRHNEGVEVSLERPDWKEPLPARTDLRALSKGDLDWGSTSPESAQLALALSAYLVGDQLALVVWSRFLAVQVSRYRRQGFRFSARVLASSLFDLVRIEQTGFVRFPSQRCEGCGDISEDL